MWSQSFGPIRALNGEVKGYLCCLLGGVILNERKWSLSLQNLLTFSQVQTTTLIEWNVVNEKSSARHCHLSAAGWIMEAPRSACSLNNVFLNCTDLTEQVGHLWTKHSKIKLLGNHFFSELNLPSAGPWTTSPDVPRVRLPLSLGFNHGTQSEHVQRHFSCALECPEPDISKTINFITKF